MKEYLYLDEYLEPEMKYRILDKEELKEVKTRKFNRQDDEKYLDGYLDKSISILDEVLEEYEEFKFGRIDISSPEGENHPDTFYKELLKYFTNLKRGNVFNDVLYRYIWKIEKGETGKIHMHMALFWRPDVNPEVMGIELGYYLKYLSKYLLGKEITFMIGYRDGYRYFKTSVIDRNNKYGINSCLLYLRYLCKDDGKVSKEGYRDFGSSQYRHSGRRYNYRLLRGFPYIGEYTLERDGLVVQGLKANNQYQRLRFIEGSLGMRHIENIKREFSIEDEKEEKVDMLLYLVIEGNGVDTEDRIEELNLEDLGDYSFTLLGSMGNWYYSKGKVYRQEDVKKEHGRVLSSMDHGELKRYWYSLKTVIDRLNSEKG